MPEAATWLTFLVCAIVGVLFLLHRETTARLASSNASLLVTGVVGSIGSLLFVLSAALQSWSLLVAGALLAGVFMPVSILGWGALYCSDGTRTAVLYFAGAFACTILLNALFVVLMPPASALAPVVLPFAANALLLTAPRELRSYERVQVAAASGVAVAASPAASCTRLTSPASSPTHERVRRTLGYLRHSLGIRPGIVLSMVFIMFGLGYMQDTISFSGVFSTSAASAVLTISLPRSLCAAVAFAITLAAPRRARAVYRTGLLVIVAGFSLLPLVLGTHSLWVSASVMLAGYATFDVLIWIVVAQAAHARFGDPVFIVSLMRVAASSVACVVGGVSGMLLSDLGPAGVLARAIFVGYLVTIAVVLVLSDRDVWDLFDARPAPTPEDGAGVGLQSRLNALAAQWGLTDREREVFSFLAVGRTQPWVAGELGISESTVNTHVRHIYGKAGVNSRQDLIDLVFRGQSSESVDPPSHPDRT